MEACPGRLAAARPHGAVGFPVPEQPDQEGGVCRLVLRIDQVTGDPVLDHVGQAADPRDHDRHPGGHGLLNYHGGGLLEGDQHQAAGQGQLPQQLLAGEVARKGDRLFQAERRDLRLALALVLGRLGEPHHAQGRPGNLTVHPGEQGDQSVHVLALADPTHEQQARGCHRPLQLEELGGDRVFDVHVVSRQLVPDLVQHVGADQDGVARLPATQPLHGADHRPPRPDEGLVPVQDVLLVETVNGKHARFAVVQKPPRHPLEVGDVGSDPVETAVDAVPETGPVGQEGGDPGGSLPVDGNAVAQLHTGSPGAAGRHHVELQIGHALQSLDQAVRHPLHTAGDHPGLFGKGRNQRHFELHGVPSPASVAR